MLPAKGGGTSNQTTTNTNRCLIKSAIERTVVRLKETPIDSGEQDVTGVEYDIINYYADAATPRVATVSPHLHHQQHQQQQQPSSSLSSSVSRGSSNHNNGECHPALDASSVVVVAPARKTTPPGSMEVSVIAAEAPERPFNQKKLEQQQTKQQSLLATRSRGGGGAVQSRLRRHPRSHHTECSSNSNSPTSTASSASNPSPCSTLGVNMRVTGQCSQGGRKYMEDQFSVAYQESPLTHELEYAFFGIYDGHGGPEAALFAKEHLMLEIVKQKLFWSDNDEDVLRAIREGYIATHFAMWREQEKWPRTANGHLSTAGTTATVAFMRREKIYIGHVGDSGIVLGYQKKGERNWRARQLTTDHKPESVVEKMRIQRSGGNVAIKSGVPRVVWNRPRDPMHRGPIRRRTVVDDIPFLAVARSLGDLWSYNSRCKEFVVSPDPDVKVVKIDPNTFRCLIFGTDGLWNVVTAQEAVDSVRKEHLIGEILNEQDVMNPSKALVDQALKTWASKKMRADNTSVVTVILTPAASHHTHNSQIAAAATAQAQSALARDPDMNVELLLDVEDNEDDDDDDGVDEDAPVDIENDCPQEFLIEEEEYVLDTPYSALAKRHLPPEAYRDFDYFGMDEDTPDEDEDEPENDEEEEQSQKQPSSQINDKVQQSLLIPRKVWRKSTWNGEAELEPDPEPDEHHRPVLDMCAIYANSLAPAPPAVALAAVATNSAANSSELEQHLESSYSFAESYNTLLNEQEEQEARSRSAAAAAAVEAAAAAGATSAGQSSVHSASVVVDRSMQDIIQEQQHYQQQEGYSLTQLETRREQMQQEREQEPQQVAAEVAGAWQQPVELLELNALLQQERAEEEQVALEQQQQQQQQQQQRQQQQHQREISQMEVASSSSGQQEYGFPSGNWSITLPDGQHLIDEVADESEMAIELEMEMDLEQELQDNEVSSTLPATPTRQMEQLTATVLPQKTEEEQTKIQDVPLQQKKKVEKPRQEKEMEQGLVAVLESVAEIRKEDAHAVHYIFEQIQKLQESEISPAVANPGVEEALERASVLASEPRMRQMRRYRNVPNENHQHMQTRRRQIFKHGKPKSFINASAAAIVAYTNDTGSSGVGGASGSANTMDRVGGGGVGPASGSNPSAVAATPANRRRTVNVVAVAATSAGNSGGMTTRRSHSHSLSTSGNVSKRQLRSSLCNLGLGLGLSHDITKRTLRTRNVPGTPPAVVVGPSPANGGNGPPIAASTPRVTSNRDSSRSNSSSSSSSNSNGSGSSRRLKRSHNDREQRRSLRRSTLTASAIVGGVAAQSKPTRLQACNGAISARPPPSPKKLHTSVPTLAIGTRAYTAALAAAADHLNKRWSLRSSSSNGGGSMMTAISCYSARSRAAAAAAAAAAAGAAAGAGAGAGATEPGIGSGTAGAGGLVAGGVAAVSAITGSSGATRRR